MVNPHPTPIPGLRSPYDEVGGIVYFGRMLDKIRLHAVGKLPPAWVSCVGTPYPTTFDGRCCRFLDIEYDLLEIEKLFATLPGCESQPSGSRRGRSNFVAGGQSLLPQEKVPEGRKQTLAASAV